MFVIEVIPLVRGAQIESLTYYSAANYTPGTIISVPIRSNTKRALVIGSSPVSTAKTALRAATFTLKKLPPQTVHARIPALIMALADALTKQLPAERGAILFSLLPKEIITGECVLLDTPFNPNEGPVQTAIVHGTYEDRFRAYRSRIRETFAHRGSVLFVVPTAADVERARAYLEKGIENRIITFSSAYTKRKLKLSYEQSADLSHAKLIITTATHAFIDRHDITEIIIDQSRSRAYKLRTRPYLDIRDALKVSAKLAGRNVLLGDLVPRTEDEYLRREDIYATEEEVPNRISFNSDFTVVTHLPDKLKSETFSLLAPEMAAALRAAAAERTNTFIYAARRGIAPVVACMDCGYIFRCPESGAPYSLFKTVKNGEEKRWFVASASGKRIKAADTCELCGSWRLRERGIGIQQIEEYLRSEFPNIPVYTFDHTTATTYRKAKKIIGDFYESKGAILLGTAMVMPYIETPIPYSMITSLDAARAIPTWRSDEELFSLLLSIREKTSHMMYVQTRTEPDDLLRLAETGNLEQFYTEELALRKQLSYPPFFTFIHLTFMGTAATVSATEAELTTHLEKWQPRFYHAPTTTSEHATKYGLLRIPRTLWPDEELMTTLRTLPPYVRIEINPDRLV